jgi:alkanesulfonate monooxygenase SsuD/methylene tetrahydromethanopterin reductase-like flavin-dependent oxidoreductase (luciferase family)
VIPHWDGEVGLNTDILQISHKIFSETKNINTGSAVMNLLCNGGPVAAAERLASFLSIHGLNPEEKRKVHIGFSAGRFDFMNRAFGIIPQHKWEEEAWMAVRGQIFSEATEIFLRLLAGETLSSDQVPLRYLRKENFRTEEDWEKVSAIADSEGLLNDGKLEVDKRFVFEPLKIIPQDYRQDLLDLVIGTHDPNFQKMANEFLPVKVFNLSITQPEVIEKTHERMASVFHKDGGPWNRTYMPRTVFVFLNEDEDKSVEQRRDAAKKSAENALGHYWAALEGTIDPMKVAKAADNALIGDSTAIISQMQERFHPDDRLMLWFDFFNHNSKEVMKSMKAFMEKVAPEFKKNS